MKVTIPVTFEVEPVEALEEGETFSENTAKDAASQAAFDYLSFCTVSGVNTDTDEVTVHVDGFGECTVRLAQEDS